MFCKYLNQIQWVIHCAGSYVGVFLISPCRNFYIHVRSEVVFIALCPAFGLEADWPGTRGSCPGALSEHPACCKDELFRPSRSTDVSEMAGRDEGGVLVISSMVIVRDIYDYIIIILDFSVTWRIDDVGESPELILQYFKDSGLDRGLFLMGKVY